MTTEGSGPPIPSSGPDSPYRHLRKLLAGLGIGLVAIGVLLLAFPSLLSFAQVIGLTFLSAGVTLLIEEIAGAFERRDRREDAVRQAQTETIRFQAISSELRESKVREVEASSKLRQLEARLKQSDLKISPLTNDADTRRRTQIDEEKSALLAGIYYALIADGRFGPIRLLFPAPETAEAGPPRSVWFYREVDGWEADGSRKVYASYWAPDLRTVFLQVCERLGLSLTADEQSGIWVRRGRFIEHAGRGGLPPGTVLSIYGTSRMAANREMPARLERRPVAASQEPEENEKYGEEWRGSDELRESLIGRLRPELQSAFSLGGQIGCTAIGIWESQNSPYQSFGLWPTSTDSEGWARRTRHDNIVLPWILQRLRPTMQEVYPSEARKKQLGVDRGRKYRMSSEVIAVNLRETTRSLLEETNFYPEG